MAARRGKRSAVDRALFHMKPNRITARFASGGRHQTWTAIVKSPFRERTVATPKSGRRRYQQQMARDRRQLARAAAAERRRVATELKAARAEQRRRQPRTQRTRRPRPAPIAVNPRTGRPITYAQAKAAVRAAEREAARIEAGKPARPTRKNPRPANPLTPQQILRAAIRDVKAKQQKPAKKPSPKPATQTPAKPAQRRNPRTAKPGNGVTAAIAGLIPGTAVVRPQTPARATPGASITPQPLSPHTRAARRARRGIYGEVLRRTCACGGTGRIPAYDQNGDPHGSTSCPQHGRQARGERKRFARTAARDAGLPGLRGFLASKRRKKNTKRLDKHQARSAYRATADPRRMGPTQLCPKVGRCTGGIWDRKDRDREREVWIAEHVEACRAEGRRVPSRRRLGLLASRALPYVHCDTCGGLGRVPTSAQVTQSGQMPVWEWRQSADLRDGHHSTARERSTGRAATTNARRAARRRKLPRL